MRQMLKEIITIVVGGVLLLIAIAAVAWLALSVYGMPIPP